MNIALVTGASSGLGEEYVLQIAKGNKERDAIDEIWAVARRIDRLNALKAALGKASANIALRPISIDLTDEAALNQLEDALKAKKPNIRILINAAGFGCAGSALEIGRERSAEMINLNCRAAVEVTQMCLPYMKAGARILEICSTAAFQPFPYLAVYAASKAFLYRYSRALRVELFGRKIRVTAVCPYWIKDTEFIPTAAKKGSKRAIRHFPLASKKSAVVRRSLADSRLSLAVSTPGPVCAAHRLAAKLIPSCIMMGLWGLIRRV